MAVVVTWAFKCPNSSCNVKIVSGWSAVEKTTTPGNGSRERDDRDRHGGSGSRRSRSRSRDRCVHSCQLQRVQHSARDLELMMRV
jgi:hypothetical protein